MQKAVGFERCYQVLSKANHAAHSLEGSDFVDEIMFGLYDATGASGGEMAIRFYELNGRVVARLEVFHEAWSLLPQFPEVVAALGKLPASPNRDISVESVCYALQECGFQECGFRES